MVICLFVSIYVFVLAKGCSERFQEPYFHPTWWKVKHRGPTSFYLFHLLLDHFNLAIFWHFNSLNTWNIRPIYFGIVLFVFILYFLTIGLLLLLSSRDFETAQICLWHLSPRPKGQWASQCPSQRTCEACGLCFRVTPLPFMVPGRLENQKSVAPIEVCGRIGDSCAGVNVRWWVEYQT